MEGMLLRVPTMDSLAAGHLVHITDDPAHAETVSRHQRVGELMNVCPSTGRWRWALGGRLELHRHAGA